MRGPRKDRKRHRAEKRAWPELRRRLRQLRGHHRRYWWDAHWGEPDGIYERTVITDAAAAPIKVEDLS